MGPTPLRKTKPLQVMGLGNPLLDLITEAPTSLIEKYKLELNNMHLAQQFHMPIYQEIQDEHKFKYVPGGATLNSMRFLQALSGKNESVIYSGCVGKDKEGAKMAQLLSEEGLSSYFEIHDTIPTGLCAVLCNNNDRALCTYLGASACFTYKFFLDNVKHLTNKADIFYSASYFMSSSPETMFDLSNFCAENDKIYSFGLAAPSMVELFTENMKLIMKNTDILFGNVAEYMAFAKATEMKFEQIEDIITQIAVSEKTNSKRHRIVVVTQGSNPVIIAEGWPIKGATISKYPTANIPEDKIIDVNGSGDAFVGGFLYGVANHLSIDGCAYYGIHAATHVIQKIGAAFSTEELSKIPPFQQNTS